MIWFPIIPVQEAREQFSTSDSSQTSSIRGNKTPRIKLANVDQACGILLSELLM
jgi:hypothetical protein